MMAAMCFLFAQCAKEEVNKGNSEVITNNPIVENRNGLNANRPTFFLTSGTWSNYMEASSLPNSRVYRAYNYGLVDSITLTKVSAGNAQITYTSNGLKYNAANFDIFLYYKNGVVDTMPNTLSKYTGVNQYTYIPDPSKDLILYAQPNVVYVRYSQRASSTDMMIPNTGTVIKIHNWDVHQWTGLSFRNIGRREYQPQKPFDFEFILDNQP